MTASTDKAADGGNAPDAPAAELAATAAETDSVPAASAETAAATTTTATTTAATTAAAVAVTAADVTSAKPSRFRRRTASARRRRRYSAVVMTLALAATGIIWSSLAPAGAAQETADANEAVRAGRALFLQGCSSCHGLEAQGTQQGPTLIGVGAAAVDFQVSTGRMPLANPGAQAPAKPPAYSQTEIDQLAAYIQTLGGGPEIPEVSDAELSEAELSFGGELFRANCAQCHQAGGAGAPLTYGKYAPALSDADPVLILEAMRTGPESMPVFGEGQIDEEGAVAIAAYVQHLQDTPAPGGLSLGSYGPVPEGLLAWLVGIGGLLAVCLWIGARQKR